MAPEARVAAHSIDGARTSLSVHILLFFEVAIDAFRGSWVTCQVCLVTEDAILNDFATADNKPRIFDESGAFGPKTKEHVQRFQQKHSISPASGIVGPKTWKALLERWAALRPLPLA